MTPATPSPPHPQVDSTHDNITADDVLNAADLVGTGTAAGELASGLRHHQWHRLHIDGRPDVPAAIIPPLPSDRQKAGNPITAQVDLIWSAPATVDNITADDVLNANSI